MLNVLHIYITFTYFHNRERNFFSNIYSEYAENVYNVQRNFRLLNFFGGDWKLGDRVRPKRCLDKTVPRNSR